MAENHHGRITAIDPDRNSLDWLRKKIIDKNLIERIITLNVSFADFKSDPDYFDIIIAEGFLNVVGFEKTFPEIIRILRKKRYLIIHDEYDDHEKKCEFIERNHCRIIDNIFLDEQVWWNDYHRLLEKEIGATILRAVLKLI